PTNHFIEITATRYPYHVLQLRNISRIQISLTMVKSIIVIVAICLVSLPNPTVGSQKKPWPMPSDLANHNGKFGDSKIPGIPNIPIPQIPGIPNIPIPQIPGIPNIPIPQIPGIPIIPGLPNIPKKCLTGDKSKGSEKCFSQVFSSWADNDLSLDKECCEIVLNMDKKCNGHLHMMFKSHFFAPLLQYSCHIKHAKKN
ncbi:hypothetical protein HID58_081890, partial [Brassica napus]